MRTKACLAIVVTVLVPSFPVLAQYWGERVLEKSFEQAEFFFLPNYLLPYGLGTFRTAAPGLIDEPLLNVAVNPAYLSEVELTRPYVYLDFRNTLIVEEQAGFPWTGPYPDYGVTPITVPYPWFYVQTRRVAEPVVSAALMARPFGRRLSLGLTYQALLQDQPYYAIPQDIYRAQLGADYAGNRTARPEDIPIVDTYKGTDQMHEEGHFLTLLGAYRLFQGISLGAKVNRSTFDRDGALGSQNAWNGWPGDYQSLWRSQEERTQNYGHWEVAGGVSFEVNKKVALGTHVGYLWGEATQWLARGDSSFWHYARQSDSSLYVEGGATTHDWQHRGQTVYGALTFRAQLTPAHRVTGYYLYLSQRVDLTSRSATRDSSFSTYFSQWDSDWYWGQWESALRDVRTGSGNSPRKVHRLAIGVQWQLEPQMRLHLGVTFEDQHRSVATDEAVIASRHTGYQNLGNKLPPASYYQRTEEGKTLYWDFNVRERVLHIPVVFTWQAAKPVELLLGLDRSMKQWDITDVTTAIFDFREITQDSLTTRRTRFGERYTEPREKQNEVQTTFLTGVTFKPSAHLAAHLLGVPHYASSPAGMTLHEVQWWLALTLNM